MTVWAPELWNPGDDLTSDQMNTLLSGPYYRLAATDAQTVPDDAGTDVEWDTVVESNDRYPDVTVPAAELAVPIDGTYGIVGTVAFAAAAGGAREATITAGGIVVGGISQPAVSDRPWAGQLTAVANLAADDPVTLNVYQNTGGDLDTSPGTLAGCQLAVVWLGLR